MRQDRFVKFEEAGLLAAACTAAQQLAAACTAAQQLAAACAAAEHASPSHRSS
jgi:hypothetical protein